MNRLKSNFFELDEMTLLEEYKNSTTLQILYIKLLTKGKHLERGYKFLEDKLLGDSVRYIALKTNESHKVVEESIPYLIKLNLVQLSGNLIIIRDVNIDVDRNRTTKEYKDWRKSVYERDNYTCQKCGVRGGRLNAHHVKPWAKYPAHRFKVDNGLTLCVECHKMMHAKSGEEDK